MKIIEETTVSEEQVLFNKLRYEDQELIIKIMKTLQPCEVEEKKIPEKLNLDKDELLKKVIITAQDYVIEGKINEIIDYLKSKGDE